MPQAICATTQSATIPTLSTAPIWKALWQRRFRREEVRQKVIPAYMGLIKQCDDQLGVLLDYLDRSAGRMDDTMIVLTSDHGDYLGDHWLGEKDLFHDPSVKIPLIVYDPRQAGRPDPRHDL